MSQESQSTDKEIQPLREEINQIDARIVELLDKEQRTPERLEKLRAKPTLPSTVPSVKMKSF